VRTGTELLKAYTRYCERQTAADAAHLWGSILQYDFEDYNDFAVAATDVRAHHACRGETREITSNGSSGRASLYRFGPLPDFWLELVERHIKGRQFYTLHVELPLLTGADPARFGRGLLPCPWPRHADAAIAIDPAHDGLVQLAATVQRLHDEHGQLALVASPTAWLRLAREPQFRSVLGNDIVTSVVSTGSDGFFAREPFRATGVVVNDHCINWRGGTNFYTCDRGGTHVLPVFGGSTTPLNLLNLATTPSGRDDLQSCPEPDRLCDCGCRNVIHDFIPHPEYWPGPVRDLGLADRLAGCYRILQFIRCGDMLHVLGDLPPAYDADVIVAHAKTYGLTPIFETQSYFRVGAKLPAFWRDDSLPPAFPRLPAIR
jgi:hypothetical protein